MYVGVTTTTDPPRGPLWLTAQPAYCPRIRTGKATKEVGGGVGKMGFYVTPTAKQFSSRQWGEGAGLRRQGSYDSCGTMSVSWGSWPFYGAICRIFGGGGFPASIPGITDHETPCIVFRTIITSVWQPVVFGAT